MRKSHSERRAPQEIAARQTGQQQPHPGRDARHAIPLSFRLNTLGGCTPVLDTNVQTFGNTEGFDEIFVASPLAGARKEREPVLAVALTAPPVPRWSAAARGYGGEEWRGPLSDGQPEARKRPRPPAPAIWRASRRSRRRSPPPRRRSTAAGNCW